jgi:hypothetical protein
MLPLLHHLAKRTKALRVLHHEAPLDQLESRGGPFACFYRGLQSVGTKRIVVVTDLKY